MGAWPVELVGVGKLVRFGKLPVDFRAQGFGKAENPENAAEWSAEIRVKLLFPK